MYQSQVSRRVERIFTELTATVTLPRIDSGIGWCDFLVSLSKQDDINSIQIHTSASVIKQPRHCTMYGQSWDLSTTSISIIIRFSSSELFVRRICCNGIIGNFNANYHIQLRRDQTSFRGKKEKAKVMDYLDSDQFISWLVSHFNYMAAGAIA